MELVIQSNRTDNAKVLLGCQERVLGYSVATVTAEGANFGVRMRYAIFLQGWLTGTEPTQTAIAEAVDRTQPAVRDWLDREGPPTDYRIHQPLADVLHVPRTWLIDGQGDPPDAAMWAVWWKRERSRLTPSRTPPIPPAQLKRIAKGKLDEKKRGSR